MRLIYWYAENTSDSDCYSIINKTKRGAQQEVAAHGGRFEPVVKRTLDYKDAFDLLFQATGEGGGRSVGSRAAL